MALSRFLRASAVLAAASGLVISGAMPAFSVTTPAISITASSQLRPVTTDVFVSFHGGASASARLAGQVTGATSGEVVRLLAQPFPFSKPAVRVQVLSLTATGSEPYTFTVKPQLATRYTVELLSDNAATTPLASSVTKTIYLITGGSINGPQRCGRPVCTQTFHVRIVLPPATLRREALRHWFVYLGLHLGKPGTTPSAAKTLKLNAKATVSKRKRVSADTFRFTIKFSFRVNGDAFRWIWTACTKDIESTDGVGLPGRHSCGNKRIKASVPYLG
jgi:hypothetical protein